MSTSGAVDLFDGLDQGAITSTVPLVKLSALPKDVVNSAGAAQIGAVSPAKFRRLVLEGKGPKPAYRAGAGRGGALWYTLSAVNEWKRSLSPL